MRRAKCGCGQFSIQLSGDPSHVLVCHCRECQQATGSAFGVSTYWPKSAIVEIIGSSTCYTRSTEAGRRLTNHFCPVCGVRPCWFAEFLPDHIGVAIGCFEEPDLPRPTAEYWTVRKWPWVAFDGNLQSFEGDG